MPYYDINAYKHNRLRLSKLTLRLLQVGVRWISNSRLVEYGGSRYVVLTNVCWSYHLYHITFKSQRYCAHAVLQTVGIGVTSTTTQATCIWTTSNSSQRIQMISMTSGAAGWSCILGGVISTILYSSTLYAAIIDGRVTQVESVVDTSIYAKMVKCGVLKTGHLSRCHGSPPTWFHIQLSSDIYQ